MKINNVLSLTLITLLLLSIVPYTLSACTKVPVADDDTKEKAEEEMDKAKKEWEKAEREYRTVQDLNELANMKLIGKIIGDGVSFPEGVHEGLNKAQREQKEEDAQQKATTALQDYYTAYEYWLSVQDVEVHPRYIPACGNRSHGITMCDSDDMDKYMDKYWRNWHEIRETSCLDYTTINGITYYCTVSNFFFCQFHTHIYGLPYSSSSN